MIRKSSLLILLLISSPLLAGPLDILDAKGSFDGRFGRTSTYDGTTREISLDISQGVRFAGAPFVEPYVGFSKYQQLEATSTEWISMGIKNKTFLPPFTFGFEYRDIVEPTENPNSYMIIGYVSIYHEWNLKGGKKDEE